jgi:hypothetical protein
MSWLKAGRWRRFCGARRVGFIHHQVLTILLKDMKFTDKIHLLQIDFEIAITPEKKLTRFVNVIIIFGDKITLV